MTTQSVVPASVSATKVISCPNCGGTGVFVYPRTGREEGCFVCGGTRTMQGSGQCTELRAYQWQQARIAGAQRARSRGTALTPYTPPAELPISDPSEEPQAS